MAAATHAGPRAVTIAGGGPPLRDLTVAAYTVPTATPESDGTLEWESTTMVLVEVAAGDARGIGYSYTAPAAATLIADQLADVVTGRPALDVPGTWLAMVRSIRNLGRAGIASTAIAAVDVALWDLKARLLGVSLASLFGAVTDAVDVYGSGGFTSYSLDELSAHVADWAEQGIPRVKIKIGRDPATDAERVRVSRRALGDDGELFVDANGAYARKQALAQAARFSEHGVSWYEEPVSSDDLDGLRLIRDRAPAGMEVTAGEYGYDAHYFRRMLDAGAVDVLQADATRCAGLTGFMHAASLCHARSLPLSSHTAPAIHLPAAVAVPAFRHLEYFYDHVRIERMFFEGVPVPEHGRLSPDRSRPGLGLELRRADADRYRVA